MRAAAMERELASMRVGILVPLSDSRSGTYQHIRTLLGTLGELAHEGLLGGVVILTNQPQHPVLRESRGDGVFVVSAPLFFNEPPTLRSRLRKVARAVAPPWFRLAVRHVRNRIRPAIEPNAVAASTFLLADPVDHRLSKAAQCLDIDLLVVPYQADTAYRTGVRSVMFVLDIQHRLHPEFPEVSADGEWEARERVHANAAKHVAVLVADSEVGREDLLSAYAGCGLTEERVAVLPFLPSLNMRDEATLDEREAVRTKHRLPESYAFYPASFWPHKNHQRLVQAVALLRHQLGLDVPLVLCGSHSGELAGATFTKLMSSARDLDVLDLVQYIGRVDDEDLSALYAGATLLAMPTFFGPTNIPIVEAWCAGCPVITSDIRGVREQVGDAGILVDPESPVDIAAGIASVWDQPELRAALADRGSLKLERYSTDRYRRDLAQILAKAASIPKPDGVH